MNDIKERWEIFIGYVALIVSLSAFKTELSEINLDVGFVSFSASQFLFVLILSFLFCLHLYLVPFLIASKGYFKLKVFSYLESFTYFLFVLLIASPFFILLAVLTNQIINIFQTIPNDTKSYINLAVSLIIGIVSGIISQRIANKYVKQKYSNQKEELENLEIEEFENAQKLFNDGYFSQSILEAFKVLEIHLKRLIIQKDLPFRSRKINDLISIANKLELINRDEINKFDDIRKMRNSAAHLDMDFTRSQAQEAISFIRELIEKTRLRDNKETT